MNRSYKIVLKRRVKVAPVAMSFLVAVALAVQWNSIASSHESEAPKQSETAKQSGDAATDSTGDESKEPTRETPYTPKTKAQLRYSLTPIQYKVTQNEETETAFRNKYWDNKKEGIYRCIVCDQSVFSSETKFKSGTGWPSFYDPIKKDHVGYRTDFHLFYPRKEVHCSRCNAHLGHVFDDGPTERTGKRYCMNSAAMKFEPNDKRNAKSKTPATKLKQ